MQLEEGNIKLVFVLSFLDIKLIMDFIPNHSSIEHDFFEKSAQNDDIYINWYTWADEQNNWASSFPTRNLSVVSYGDLLRTK